ncbi:MAG: PilZ domain-containing protein [Candidatus Adiutrix sp.]|jgi:hypothetical protein|nr:PilZ domain-containing protein [Candidatus Adiutrix sp.]
MCAANASRASRPVDPKRLLRPQTRLDIILNTDFMTGQSDVRSSMILDITPDYVVAAQSDPPILKSMVDRIVEATIVHHDFLTYQSTRWGWSSRLLNLNNDYRINPKDPQSVMVSAVYLSLPGPKGLQKSNVRQAYRLDAGSGGRIKVEMSPAPVSLLNFSAGGMMLATPAPPKYNLGHEVDYSLLFPADGSLDQTTIRGRAVVVRLEYEPGEAKAKLGLKFLDLSPETFRNLEKVINYYMLEEQRRRNREF